MTPGIAIKTIGILLILLAVSLSDKCREDQSMPLDPAIIKPAPQAGPPPGLFHVIVEVNHEGREMYILTPMKDRAIRLEWIPEEQFHDTVEVLAAAITKLPENTAVYVARPDAIIAESKHLRPVTIAEVEQLRRLLAESS
jgi:hypothetical protein